MCNTVFPAALHMGSLKVVRVCLSKTHSNGAFTKLGKLGLGAPEVLHSGDRVHPLLCWPQEYTWKDLVPLSVAQRKLGVPEILHSGDRSPPLACLWASCPKHVHHGHLDSQSGSYGVANRVRGPHCAEVANLEGIPHPNTLGLLLFRGCDAAPMRSGMSAAGHATARFVTGVTASYARSGCLTSPETSDALNRYRACQVGGLPGHDTGGAVGCSCRC